MHDLESSDGRSMTPWIFRAVCGLLTLAYLLVALRSISDLPLLDPDEPRYAGSGRTMAEGGSWFVPEFNGEPRINKPPLFYWLVAVSDKLAGRATETSSRLPSVAMGLVMLWSTIWLGRRVFGATTGLLAGAVLASTPLFIALSRTCITDMTLAAFMTGTLAWLMLARLGLAPPQKSKWFATIWYGLALLTKATPAFAVLLVVVIERAFSLPKEQRPTAARWIPWVLLAAIVFSATAIQCEAKGKLALESKHAKAAAVSDESSDGASTKKNNWTMLDGVFGKCALGLAIGVVGLLIVMAYRAERLSPALPRGWIWGLLISIAMVLWWYGLLIATQGWERFVALLQFEINQRVAGAVHREVMYYYLAMLPMVTFPWSIGLAGALGSAWPSPVQNTDENTGVRRNQNADEYLVAWVLGTVFFYSIPGAKLPTYIMLAIPAVALLIARFLMRLSDATQPVSRMWLRTTVALSIVAALGLLLVPLVFYWISAHPPAIPTLATPAKSVVALPFLNSLGTVGYFAFLGSFAIGAALAFPGSWIAAVRGRGRLACGIICVCTLALLFFAAPAIVEQMKSRSSKQLAAKIEGVFNDQDRIKSLGIPPESLSYYLKRPVQALHWVPLSAGKSGLERMHDLIGNGEGAAMIIEKKFVPRMLGKSVELSSKSVDTEIVKSLIPPDLAFIYADENVLIVRNRVK